MLWSSAPFISRHRAAGPTDATIVAGLPLQLAAVIPMTYSLLRQYDLLKCFLHELT